jgi:hypothetical protein
MSATPVPPASRGRRAVGRAGADRLRPALAALAALQLGTGLFLAVAPGAFYDAIANFGPENHHDLRDMSAFYLASAVVLWVSLTRRSWRAPVLALVGLQYALHALNHLLDVGDADPGWIGPFDLVALALGAALVALAFRSAEEDRS